MASKRKKEMSASDARRFNRIMRDRGYRLVNGRWVQKPADSAPASSGNAARHRYHINSRENNLDPIRNFRFRVKIKPYSVGGWADDAFPAYMGFTSVTGMSMTMTSIPLQEGGLNTTTHQLPGLASYSPVTFQKGVFLGDEENWQWLRRLAGTVGNAGYGAPGGNFRCAVKIDVLSHPNPGSRALGGGFGDPRDAGAGWFYSRHGDEFGTEVNDDHASISFLLSKAWITTLSYSDLNAGDSALLIEQMTLVHEGMHVDWSETWSGTANAFNGYDKTPEVN